MVEIAELVAKGDVRGALSRLESAGALEPKQIPKVPARALRRVGSDREAAEQLFEGVFSPEPAVRLCASRWASRLPPDHADCLARLLLEALDPLRPDAGDSLCGAHDGLASPVGAAIVARGWMDLPAPRPYETEARRYLFDVLSAGMKILATLRLDYAAAVLEVACAGSLSVSRDGIGGSFLEPDVLRGGQIAYHAFQKPLPARLAKAAPAEVARFAQPWAAGSLLVHDPFDDVTRDAARCFARYDAAYRARAAEFVAGNFSLFQAELLEAQSR